MFYYKPNKIIKTNIIDQKKKKTVGGNCLYLPLPANTLDSSDHIFFIHKYLNNKNLNGKKYEKHRLNTQEYF